MKSIPKELIDGISFDWSEMKWRGITMEYIEFLEQSFPDADVKATLDALTTWLHRKRNQKKAHKKDWHGFLMVNMRKAQIKAVL